MPATDLINAVQKKGNTGTVLLAIVLALGGGAVGNGVGMIGTGERLARLEERVEAMQKTLEKIGTKLEAR